MIYEGKVTVNVINKFNEIIRQDKIKNRGLIGLFSYLSNCLINKVYEYKKPSYISVQYSVTEPSATGTSNDYQSLFPLYNAPVRGTVEDDVTDIDNPNSTAVIRAVLKGEYLAIHMNASTNNYYYKYVLLDNDLNIIAQCPCCGTFTTPGYGALSELNSSTSAEVVWEMTVANNAVTP